MRSPKRKARGPKALSQKKRCTQSTLLFPQPPLKRPSMKSMEVNVFAEASPIFWRDFHLEPNKFSSATIYSQTTPEKKPTFAFLMLSSLNNLCIKDHLGKTQDLDCAKRSFGAFTIANQPHLAFTITLQGGLFPLKFLKFHRASRKKTHTLSSHVLHRNWRPQTRHQTLNVPGYSFVECTICQMHYLQYLFFLSFASFHMVLH